MRTFQPALLVSYAAFALTFGPTAAQRPASGLAEAHPPRAGAAPRVHCESPRTLHLRRFEDGSAQLLCARRVIVRISVPG